MAEFFGSHMAGIFYFMFGDFWQNMRCLYVDDIGPHTFTDEQLELRCRLLEACLEVFDKPICTKFWENGNRPRAQSSMILAGIEFTAQGVTIGQNTVDTMKYVYACTEMKVDTPEKAGHIQGCFAYVQSAFEFDIEECSKTGELIAPIQTAITTKPFKWTEECRVNSALLYSMITRGPRVYTDPRMILCPGRCIIIKTDCGAEAIGYALVLVDRPCVRMVTDLDILKDRSMSRLIATNVYNFKETQHASHGQRVKESWKVM